MKLFYTLNINQLMSSAATYLQFKLLKKKIPSEPPLFSPQDGALLSTLQETFIAS